MRQGGPHVGKKQTRANAPRADSDPGPPCDSEEARTAKRARSSKLQPQRARDNHPNNRATKAPPRSPRCRSSSLIPASFDVRACALAARSYWLYYEMNSLCLAFTLLFALPRVGAQGGAAYVYSTTLIAGSETSGASNGVGSNALFALPRGIAAVSGNVFVVDTGN